MSRGRVGPVFSRGDGVVGPTTSKDPDWFKEYATAMEKNSVKSEREDRAMFDQISDIMGNKRSPYHTVEEAVRDYQDRTGLAQFLKMNEHERTKIKQAQDVQETPVSNIPALLKEKPEIERMIRNYVESRHGHVNVEAVLHKMRDLFRRDGIESADLEDQVLKNHINNIIIEEKKLSQNKYVKDDIDLGKLDHSNEADIEQSNDAFQILMPAKL